MDHDKLFNYLTEQNKDVLIRLLRNCYDNMSTRKIRSVFGHLEKEYLNKYPVYAEIVLKHVQKFRDESLQGLYFAPFFINSKNYMEIPEETDRWFEKLAELLMESLKLTFQNDHVNAIKCFDILYQLVYQMEAGDEIIFADEYGMWLLPIDEDPCINAYIESAAAILDPDEYVGIVLSLINRSSNVYRNAKKLANEKQKVVLEETILQQNNRLNKNVLATPIE